MSVTVQGLSSSVLGILNKPGVEKLTGMNVILLRKLYLHHKNPPLHGLCISAVICIVKRAAMHEGQLAFVTVTGLNLLCEFYK
jgi:hypothetical protein